MTMHSEDSLVKKYTTIFIVVAGYWIVSITTVFVNKTLLNDLQLDAPLFITFTQTVLTALICWGTKCLSRMFPGRFHCPDVDLFDWYTIKAVLPLSIMFTLMIALNNLCLKFVSVAFYYVGRSLTTIFNVILTYLILGETTSKKCLICCAVIVLGFFLGVDQESLTGSFSIKGTIFGILGSLALSLFSIFTKRVLPKVNGEVWTLLYANNTYASILFIPLIILNQEIPGLIAYAPYFDTDFLLILLVGGLCGCAISTLTSLQIKYTSALTHNISGTAKACAQTVLATYWYNDHKSFLWWCSNFVVLAGSAAYARIKQIDMRKQHQQNPIYHKV